MQKGKIARILGVVAIALALGVVGSVVFFSQQEAGAGWVFMKEQPNVSVAPIPVPYKKGNVYITGSGFEPGKELGIRVMMGGVLSDISFLVKPQPIANEFGAFASVWSLNREIRRKLLEAGTAYTVTIVNENGDTLATAPLMMDKAPSKGKSKKKK